MSSVRPSPRRTVRRDLPASGGQRLQGALARYGARQLAAIGLILVLLVSPWPALTVLALAAYAGVTLQQPGLTVALIPFCAPFAYRPKDLFGLSFPVVELLLLLALLGSGRQLVVHWRQQAAGGAGAAAILDAWDATRAVLRQPFGAQAVALGLLGTLSLATIADPAHRQESLREFRTVVAEPVLYFFLARYWLRDRPLRQVAVGGFIVGAAIIAALGAGQVLTGLGVVVAEGVRRATGTYPHPNALALLLVRATPFALALLVLAPEPRRRRPLLVACPILAVGLLLTFSRGALLGLAVAALALALVADRRAVRLGILGVAVVGAMLLPALAGTRLDLLVEGGGSFELRRLIWDSTVAMIRDHPAFGVGLDQFLYQYQTRYVQPAAWGERFTAHPHNLLLDFWVRLGIMGLAWIGWTLYSVGACLVEGWRGGGGFADRAEERHLLIAAGLAVLAATVHGLLDNFYFLIDLAFLWWFLLALIQTVGVAGRGGTPAPIAQAGGPGEGRGGPGRPIRG